MKIRKKGSHNWELHLHYYRCPNCGHVVESRAPYEYRLGSYIKDLDCQRCKKAFSVTKAHKPKFGPLFN